MRDGFDWGKVAPSEHIAHFYANDEELLDALSAYVSEGLRQGDSAIVIATPEHLRALRYRMEGLDADLIRAMFEDRYITLDAHVALTSFMVNGVPDERLFSEMARSLLRRAAALDRRVRAFGEMVALLWAAGNREATVRLEQLWNQFCRTHAFSLLCGYPQSAFPSSADSTTRLSFSAIRGAHTLVVEPPAVPKTDSPSPASPKLAANPVQA